MTFFTPTIYNGDTKCQMWMTIIQDSHDIHCGCHKPYAHLLSSIFPEGHKDRGLTIQQIIDRDIQECLSGGAEEEGLGMAAGTSAATIQRDIKEDNTEEENIQDLLDAAEDAEKR